MIRGRVSLVPETPCVAGYLTARETLDYLGSILGLNDSSGESLKKVGLAGVDGLGLTYSKGMRRRLNLAEALFVGSDVLILDEPFEGLDPQMAEELVEILRSLRSEGRAILVSSHDLDLVSQIADTVVFLSHGEVIRQTQTQESPVRIRFSGDGEVILAHLAAKGVQARFEDGALIFVPSEAVPVSVVVRLLVSSGVDIHEVQRVDMRTQYKKVFEK
jgi:ABC-type multidrug transport system ATPase subunit